MGTFTGIAIAVPEAAGIVERAENSVAQAMITLKQGLGVAYSVTGRGESAPGAGEAIPCIYAARIASAQAKTNAAQPVQIEGQPAPVTYDTLDAQQSALGDVQKDAVSAQTHLQNCIDALQAIIDARTQ